MRLTLRTLLAYLDDTLEPEEAKQIGQKVAESPVAQELIERIRKVTRRRSLAPPPALGSESHLDPNTVAEYLDSTLPPDELAEVEEKCLADDGHLAEVAACHQILTLILSEPAVVPTPARQRMYRLVRGRESIPYRRPPTTRIEPSGEVEHAALALVEVPEHVGLDGVQPPFAAEPDDFRPHLRGAAGVVDGPAQEQCAVSIEGDRPVIIGYFHCIFP